MKRGIAPRNARGVVKIKPKPRILPAVLHGIEEGPQIGQDRLQWLRQPRGLDPGERAEKRVGNALLVHPDRLGGGATVPLDPPAARSATTTREFWWAAMPDVRKE